MRSLFCRKESKLNWSLFFLPDIDECSAVISNNCDVNAACTNTAGSFSCKCKRGYSGNGTNCKSKCMCLRMINAKSFGCNLKNNYSLGSCLMHMCIWHWKVLSWKYNGSLHRKGLFCFLQTWMNVLIHQRTTVTPLPVVQTPMETLLVLVTLVTKEMVLTARVSVGQWLWKGRRMFPLADIKKWLYKRRAAFQYLQQWECLLTMDGKVQSRKSTQIWGSCCFFKSLFSLSTDQKEDILTRL